VIRQKKAYPIYDLDYKKFLTDLRTHLELNYKNLYLVGRNGLHRYNNQDHAIMTSLLTVKNIVAGKNLYDVWLVNQDAEYLEVDHYDKK
jgi:protoporphyrinogen oxidase